MLEFYDFALLIFLAPTLRLILFPHSDIQTHQLLLLSIFASGYLTRIIGGIWFSHYGDRLGRKSTYIKTVAIMTAASFGIALLPSYAESGYVGLICLIFLRLIQGLSLGGEIPGAIVFAAEHSEINRRGFTTGLIVAGVTSGNVVASGLLVLLTTYLSHDSFTQYGWRLMYIAGALFSLFSLYLRQSISETPVFLELKNKVETFPAKIFLRRYKSKLILGVLITSAPAIAISSIYQLYYLSDITLALPISMHTFILLSFICTCIGAIVSGLVSDKIGRIPIIRLSCIIIFLLPLSYHCFYKCSLLLAFLPLIVNSALISGVYEATLSELMPTQIRFTGIALCLNLAFSTIGGCSPLLMEWLNLHGVNSAISWIPAFISIPLFIASFYWKDHFNLSLNSNN